MFHWQYCTEDVYDRVQSTTSESEKHGASSYHVLRRPDIGVLSGTQACCVHLKFAASDFEPMSLDISDEALNRWQPSEFRNLVQRRPSPLISADFSEPGTQNRELWVGRVVILCRKPCQGTMFEPCQKHICHLFTLPILQHCPYPLPVSLSSILIQYPYPAYIKYTRCHVIEQCSTILPLDMAMLSGTAIKGPCFIFEYSCPFL